MVGTGRGAQLGILVKGPEALEQARLVDTLVLDKTGTITCGQPQVGSIVPLAGHSPEALLAWCAAVESGSEHPLARAIVRAAAERFGSKMDALQETRQAEAYNSRRQDLSFATIPPNTHSRRVEQPGSSSGS